MQPNTPPPDSIDQQAESQLGPVVLQCRNRSPTDAWLGLGGSWLTIVVTPFLAALFMTMPLIGIAMSQKVPPSLYSHPAPA
jgi:hypothetical protein